VSEKENGIWNEGAGERELSAEKIWDGFRYRLKGKVKGTEMNEVQMVNWCGSILTTENGSILNDRWHRYRHGIRIRVMTVAKRMPNPCDNAVGIMKGAWLELKIMLFWTWPTRQFRSIFSILRLLTLIKEVTWRITAECQQWLWFYKLFHALVRTSSGQRANHYH
jgi:hypothetical protein